MSGDVTLLLPGLLPGDHQPLPLENYPAISRIVAAAKQSQVRTGGLESTVLKWFHGSAAPGQNCAAMLGFTVDFPNAAGAAFRLRADPVFQQLDINEAILADAAVLDIQSAEASAIIADLNFHFKDDGVVFRCAEPTRWYCEFPRVLNVSTYAPSYATGKSVALTMAQGSDAGVWRGWLSEIEMLLYSHTVNQERLACGKTAINSLWLWGEGDMHQLASPPIVLNNVIVFADDFYVRSICNYHNIEVGALENVYFDVKESSVLLVDDRLSSALATGDDARCESVLEALEQGVFSKLEAAFRSNPALTCNVWCGDDRWISSSAPTWSGRIASFFSRLVRRQSVAEDVV